MVADLARGNKALVGNAALSRIDLGEALAALAEARPEFLAPLLAVYVMVRLMSAYRLYLLLYRLTPAISFGRVVRLVFVSGFVGAFMPGGVGIDLLRVYGLARTTSDVALSVTSVLVERMMGLCVLILLVLVGLTLLPPGLPPAIQHVAWLGLALLVSPRYASP